MPRTLLRLAFLALLACAADAADIHGEARPAASAAPGRWQMTSDMLRPRQDHSAVLLPDGQVLVTGGWSLTGGVMDGATTSAERYDPATGSWQMTGSMSTPRYSHLSVTLPDGRALVTGGLGAGGDAAHGSTEIFDPVLGTWEQTKPLDRPRFQGTASVLPDGTVLVVGGYEARPLTQQQPSLTTAERFDPETGNWTPAGQMTVGRAGHTASVLADGRVLVAGGQDALTTHSSAEVFDPTTGNWASVPPMSRPRRNHVAVVGPGGGVLVGGDPREQLMARATSPMEVFDPVSGAWHAAASMGDVPYYAQAVLLADRRALFAGGHRGEGPRPSGLYDHVADSWSEADRPLLGACGATLTALRGGGALLAGGGCYAATTGQAQVFDPDAVPPPVGGLAGRWRTIPESRVSHSLGVFIALADGEVLAAGGGDHSRTETVHAEAEILDPATGSWRDAPPMSVPRMVAYAGLLGDGRIIAAGGITAVGAPNTYTVTTDLRDPVAGTWSPGPSLSVPREMAMSGVLADGRFLVAGGVLEDPAGMAPMQFLQTAELFDPATDTWLQVTDLPEPRAYGEGVALPDGRFLVVGGLSGWDPRDDLRTAVLYDPADREWVPAGETSVAHQVGAVALLADGRVLVAGGQVGGGDRTTIAEIFDPATLTWSPTGHLSMPRSEMAAATLWTGEVLVAGGTTTSSGLDSSEIYDPATGQWRAAARMAQTRGAYAGTAVFGRGRDVFLGSDMYGETSTIEQFLYQPDAPPQEPPPDPLPQSDPPRQVHSLKRGWRFQRGEAIGAELPSLDDSAWEPVTVPHTWNAQDGQDGGNDYYRGTGWYRTNFRVDEGPNVRKWFVDFGAANSVADVWLNGTSLGRHEGGYTRFRMEATAAVRSGDNVLAVRVSNAPSDAVAPLSGDYTMFGGLYRSVQLVSTDLVHVRQLDYGGPGVAVTQRDVSAESAVLDVVVKLWSSLPDARPVRVRAAVRDATGADLVTEENEQAIPPDSGADVPLTVRLDRPHLWNGRADPYLYTLGIEVWDGTVLRDAVTQTLGVRTVTVDPERGFLLNGRRLPIRGVNRHQDHQDLGWALGPEHHAEDMNLIAEMGANAVRLAHYPQDDLVYDLADRLGLIVWSEIPLIDGTSGTPQFADNVRTQMVEMIRQNMHHPSVAIWGVGNEVTQNASRPDPDELIGTLADLVRREDPSRISAIAHCCTADDGATVRNTDLVGYNRYFGWYGGSTEDLGPWADALHARAPNLALAISEYGAGGSINLHADPPSGALLRTPDHTEEYQALVHERSWSQIAERPYLVGGFVWNMFDFASDARAEGDQAGRNDKGLVTYDRRVKKDAFWFYKAAWSDEPVVHIAGARSGTRLHDNVDVKVYSNADSVSVAVDGVSLGEREGNNGVFVWEGVRLREGVNRIEARGEVGGGVLRDEVAWTLVPVHKAWLPAVGAGAAGN